MARVSLILPLAPGASPSSERLDPFRRALEARGHGIEILGVSDPRESVPGGPWRSVVAESPGLASSAVAGLKAARGDVLAVLDLGRGYTPEDLARVIDRLVADEANVAVARRASGGGVRGRLADGAGLLARPLVGGRGVLSGLVAMTRDTAQAALQDCAPVGSLFALELLARADGRRAEVRVDSVSSAPRARPTLDEIRHLKRLADTRFGDASRLLQFCLVGASGMVVDLSCYALFQWIFSNTGLAAMATPVVGGSLALAVAAASAIALALTWNFSLNRRLTFNYARRGSLVRQYTAYALSNALGIGLSFALRLILPRQLAFFHRHRLAAAVVGIVAATGISFSMSRWVVFNRRAVVADQTRHDAGTALAGPNLGSERNRSVSVVD